MKIRCIVVEDEQLPRELLENFIKKFPWLKLMGQFRHPQKVLDFLKNHEVDLIFTDIRLPEFSGLHMLKKLEKKPMVIFTTAYAEYALEGYELNVVDYLLKPFTISRFSIAVEKASHLLQLTRSASSHLTANDFITVNANRKVIRLCLSDILYIQGLKEYVIFHTFDDKVVVLESLINLEKELPAERFMRVHKSYIVALDKIQTLEGKWLGVGHQHIPVGRSYRERLLQQLK